MIVRTAADAGSAMSESGSLRSTRDVSQAQDPGRIGSINSPKRGQEFTHASFRRMLPDGTTPLAVMKVTAVRRGEVFYTYADSSTNKGAWRLPVATWMDRYGAAGRSEAGGEESGG